MKSSLYIPNKLKVGFNLREDTYSGRLGYITYWDDKGNLKYQKSWENWREKEDDEQLIPLELDNVPTEGFVLNKDVGGVSGWGSWSSHDRIEKVRVYDPRGFEFEITIPNLLFILQEHASLPGKGLEGEYVYSWSGQRLVLLPVKSLEYKQSIDFTSMQSGKVTKKDMVEGCVYTTKQNTKVIYLGRFYAPVDTWPYRDEIKASIKRHIFYAESENSSGFIFEKGFTKLANKVSDEVVSNYADLVESYQGLFPNSPMVGLSLKPKKLGSVSDYYYNVINGVYTRLNITQHYRTKTYSVYLNNLYEFKDGKILRKVGYSYPTYEDFDDVSLEKIKTLTVFELFIDFEDGTQLEYSEYHEK